MSVNRITLRQCPIRVMTISAGLLLGLMLSLVPSPASAQTYCGRNDCTTGTHQISAINVTHAYYQNTQFVDYVEPVTGETWSITAYWDTLAGAGGSCGCRAVSNASATVRVDWSDSTKSWTATCTSGCNGTNGPIYGVTICGTGGCGELTTIDHSWAYELVVDLAKTNDVGCFANQGYLSRVQYVTTEVNNGDVIDGNCEHDITVSPTGQTVFGALDQGPFECVFSCAAASGPNVIISYE